MSNDRTPASDVAFTPTVKATQQCQPVHSWCGNHPIAAAQ